MGRDSALSVDLLVVGAGPAGLSCARSARDLGLTVLILDEQPEPGGQVYRSVARVTRDRPADLAFLGDDYAAGRSIVDRAHGLDRRQEATVWQIGPLDREGRRDVVWSQAGQASLARASAVVLATGAMERPVPIPGWTLPGVTSVGALQSVLKQSGIYPEGRLVLAGSGPLLLLLAAQYGAAGVPVAAILDTTPAGTLQRAITRLPLAMLGAGATVLKGLRLLRARSRATVPLWRGVTSLVAEGEGRLARVRFVDGDGIRRTIEADWLALHEGVVPNPQLARLVGAEHRWSRSQRCFHPVHDSWGETGASGVFVAGDGSGILGAEAATISGRVVAAGVAARLGRIGEAERDGRVARDLDRVAGQRWLRRFLDTLYPPPDWIGVVDDAVTVCRCEDVTAGEVRQVARHAQGINQVKAYLRSGMGMCQGRMCGLTVTEVLSSAQGTTPADAGYYRIRPPAKPVTIDELASLVPSDAA